MERNRQGTQALLCDRNYISQIGKPFSYFSNVQWHARYIYFYLDYVGFYKNAAVCTVITFLTNHICVLHIQAEGYCSKAGTLKHYYPMRSSWNWRRWFGFGAIPPFRPWRPLSGSNVYRSSSLLSDWTVPSTCNLLPNATTFLISWIWISNFTIRWP